MMLICGVCSIERKMFFDQHNQIDYGDWKLCQLQFKEGPLNILACPECSTLSIDEIFEGYKARIKAGKDLNYH